MLQQNYVAANDRIYWQVYAGIYPVRGIYQVSQWRFSIHYEYCHAFKFFQNQNLKYKKYQENNEL